MAQRFEGKNLEEALDGASQAFNVQRYQLTYHVVLEKRGFLGGMKRVVIEADINTDAQPEAAPPQAVEQERPASHAPRADRGRRGGRGIGDRGDRSARGNRGGERPRRERPGDALRAGDFAQFAADVPEQAAESESAGEVRAWCERVIALSRLELVVRSEENDTQVVIRLYGRDTRLLIERHGELLDALQVLANKAFVGRKTEKDIELDCQEFKGRRVEELEQQAKALAEQVRRDGLEQLLPAMTPIERRIVHLALRDDGDVTTESRGEGFYKRVAIIRRPPQQQEQSSTAS